MENKAQLSYTVDDPYGNVILQFSGSEILDRGEALLGYVRNGVVCDKDGSPTRAIIDGNNIDFPEKGSTDLIVKQDSITDTDGTVEAIVKGAKNPAERMLGAVAYWEFVWSLT